MLKTIDEIIVMLLWIKLILVIEIKSVFLDCSNGMKPFLIIKLKLS